MFQKEDVLDLLDQDLLQRFCTVRKPQRPKWEGGWVILEMKGQQETS